MADLRTLVEREMDRAGEPTFAFEDLDSLRVRRHRTRQVTAAVVGLGVVLILALVGASMYRSAEVPADPPDEPPADLGIFEPLAGRIVYYSNSSLWGLDPNAPSPVSTLVRVDLEGTADADQLAAFTMPLGWTSDGTELLFLREDTDDTFPYDRYLYILHADGTETLVRPEPVADAAISPDGSQIAFAPDGGGLYVVAADGGEPVRIADEGASPTFSPDGTQIAYLALPRSGCCVESGREHVWVVNADGTDAHEILADEPALEKGVFELTWSPAGDRIAMGNSLERHVAIYTFAPDGSDFTEVITGGLNPHWSPDGSQIAYGQPGRDGVVVADADGSDVRTLDVGSSGPWHPAASAAEDAAPTPVETPSPDAKDDPSPLEGEVLRFTGTSGETLGDLVAVDPVTGGERAIVEDLDGVYRAAWSADRRWVAGETPGSLWVVDETLKPRRVVRGPWIWSPTGAELLVWHDSSLSVVDPSTGLATDLASTAEDLSAVFAWSPDGTRVAFGAEGSGTIDSIDVRTGERSRLVQLPGVAVAVEAIAWSPEGSRLAIASDGGPSGLFVVDADGSDVALLAEDKSVFGFAWAPEGTRMVFTDDQGGVFVAPADGSTASLVASLPSGGAATNPVWSPDGTQIAFSFGPGRDHPVTVASDRALVIDADGSADVQPIDDVTYASWTGGSLCSSCDWWNADPVEYRDPQGGAF